MKDASDAKAPQIKCNLNNYTKILGLVQLPHWEREGRKKKKKQTLKSTSLVIFSPENPTSDLTCHF